MKAGAGARPRRADLQQVGHLVGDPKAPSRDLLGVGPAPAGEGVLDPAPVLDLADQLAVRLPGSRQPAPAGVADRVRGKLVDRQGQVLRPLGSQPGRLALAGREAADGPEVGFGEADLGRGGAGRRQLAVERPGEPSCTRIGVAGGAGTRFAELGVGAAGACDHLRIEACTVIRAAQPEALGVGEGQVEQGLVATALLDLSGVAAGPDRLADATDPPAARRRRRRTGARRG